MSGADSFMELRVLREQATSLYYQFSVYLSTLSTSRRFKELYLQRGAKKLVSYDKRYLNR